MASGTTSTFTNDTSPPFTGAGNGTEQVAGSLRQIHDWEGIPGANIRVGVSGVFTVGAQDVTVRLRAGGIPLANGSDNGVAGTVAHTFVLAANTVHRVSEMGAWMPKPSGSYRRSFAMLTFECASGNFDFQQAALNIQGNGQGQGLMVGHNVWSGLGPVPFSVDFGQFSAANLVLAFTAVRVTGGGGYHRVRLGGTWAVADGTILVDYQDTGQPSPIGGGILMIETPAVTIAKPAGIQLVQISPEGDWGHYYPSLIIREA